MTWIAATPSVLAAFGILLLPGLLATAPLRLGATARVATSGLASVATLGLAGVLFGLAQVPFAPWQPFVPAAALGAFAYLSRRRWPSLAMPQDRVRVGWLALTWASSAVVIGVVAFALVPDPERFSQTYDNIFHLSAIAHILETGDASSLVLRTLIETDRHWSFYPAAWHGLVAATVHLTGASVAVAANAAWIAVCAAIWLPGVAWLAQSLVRSAFPGIIAMIALPLGAAFAAFPYALLTWGTVYPTFLATALLPAALTIPIVTWKSRSALRRGQRTGVWVLGGVGTALAVLALIAAQPRALATWALLIAPFVIAVALTGFRAAWRGGEVRRRRALRAVVSVAIVAVLLAAAGFAYAVLWLGMFERPLDDRLGGPQARATQSVWDGLVQSVLQAWPIGYGGVVTGPAALLVLAVLGGAVVAVRTRGIRWIVVSYAVLVVLFALAAGSDDLVTKLATALWYKDRYRLSSAIPVAGVVLATAGIYSAASWVATRAEVRRRLCLALSWTVAVTSVTVIAVTGVTSSVGSVFRLPDAEAGTALASRTQLAFLADLPEWVPEGQRVLGDPWDGSTLSLLYGAREPVFPHVNGQWDSDRLALASRLELIDTDPSVCDALDRLRVRYVLYDPHELSGGDPSGNRFSSIHRAVDLGLFTPVAAEGSTTLYRIDQCGPLPGL